jgi:NADP-dependent 3-hydroxy acid dehydrogenase YdfG
MCSAPPQHEARVAREQAQGGGSIINISSIYGHLGARGASVYSASKHAVEGLTSPPRWRLRDQECGSTQSHRLASHRQSSFTTGQALHVDGGKSAI